VQLAGSLADVAGCHLAFHVRGSEGGNKNRKGEQGASTWLPSKIGPAVLVILLQSAVAGCRHCFRRRSRGNDSRDRDGPGYLCA
jgi:hypothetical protein